MSGYIRANVAALHAYTPGEQPHDPDVVKLNTNENPYTPSPAVEAALAALPADRLRKYPVPDAAPVRERVARLHGCAVEQVIVGNGSDELLALCTRAFVPDGGAIGYLTPSYSLYPVLAGIADVATRPFALDADFMWQPGTVPADHGCALFFLTNPNAPTGMLHARERVDALCGDRTGVVVIDEAYVDFADADCIDLALSRPNVLVTRTLSKSYSLAGIRAGYAVGPAPLIAALHAIRDAYNVNMLTQTAMCAALDDRAHFEATRQRVRATRARLAGALETRGFTVLPSATNFIFARPVRVPARDVFEGLRARKVYVRYFDAPAVRDYIRISVGTETETDMLLTALDAVLDAP